MANFIENIWCGAQHYYLILNANGFPIPVIFLICALFLFGRSQMNWITREKYYCDVLLNLGVWRYTLLDRLDYYQEPGSEFRDAEISKNKRFVTLEVRGRDAREAIRDLKNVSAIYLSDGSNEALNDLIARHWVIIEHEALNQEEYLNKTYNIVNSTYEVILKAARRDLKKNNFSKMMQNIQQVVKP